MSWNNNMSWRNRLLFTAKEPSLKDYIGKKVVINGEKIKIESITGNRFKPQFYEINGKHLIGMLRFHAQMLGDKSISESDMKAFEEMEVTAEHRLEREARLAREGKENAGSPQEESNPS